MVVLCFCVHAQFLQWIAGAAAVAGAALGRPPSPFIGGEMVLDSCFVFGPKPLACCPPADSVVGRAGTQGCKLQDFIPIGPFLLGNILLTKV